MKQFLKDNLHNYLMLIIVAIGLIVGLRQLNTAVDSIQENQKYRALDSFMRLEEKWSSPEMQMALLKVDSIVEEVPKETRKRIEIPLEYFEGEKGDECKLALTKVAAFFETMGYGVFRGYIDFDQANELFGYVIQKYWNCYECAIERIRIDYKDEDIYGWFQKLAKRCEEQNHFSVHQ